MRSANWSIIIALYLFLAGIASAVFYGGTLAEVLSGGKYRRLTLWGNIIALPLIVVGLLLLVVDLGKPLSFWHFIVSNDFVPMVNISSVMSQGVWFLSFFAILLVINLVLFLTGSDSLRRIISYIAAFFGILVAGYTGVLLTATSVPLWRATPFLGMLFLLSATSTGIAALVLGMKARRDTDEELMHLLDKVDVKVIVLEILAIIALMIGMAAWAPSALQSLVAGRYAVAFWLGVVFMGLIAPLAIEYREMRIGKATPGAVTLSAVLVLVGGFLMRYVILYAGQVG